MENRCVFIGENRDGKIMGKFKNVFEKNEIIKGNLIMNYGEKDEKILGEINKSEFDNLIKFINELRKRSENITDRSYYNGVNDCIDKIERFIKFRK